MIPVWFRPETVFWDFTGWQSWDLLHQVCSHLSSEIVMWFAMEKFMDLRNSKKNCQENIHLRVTPIVKFCCQCIRNMVRICFPCWMQNLPVFYTTVTRENLLQREIPLESAHCIMVMTKMEQ